MSNQYPNQFQDRPQLPPGLARALSTTNRQKGSAATPTPDISKQIDRLKLDMQDSLNNTRQTYSHDQNQDKPMRTLDRTSAAVAEGGSLQAQSRSTDRDSRLSYQRQYTHHSNNSALDYRESPELVNNTDKVRYESADSTPRNIADTRKQNMHVPRSGFVMLQDIATKFDELSLQIGNASAFDQDTKQHVQWDMTRLKMNFQAVQRTFKQEMDQLRNAKVTYEVKLDSKHKQLQDALADCDRYKDEVTALQKLVHELQTKQLRHERGLGAESNSITRCKDNYTSHLDTVTEDAYGADVEHLRQSSAGLLTLREARSIYEPSAPLNDASLHQLEESHKNWHNYVPADSKQHPTLRRQSNFMQPPIPTRPTPLYNLTPYLNSVPHATGPRTPPESSALILQKEQETPAEFKAGYQEIYGMIEGWVVTYCDKACADADQKLFTTNPKAWTFLMSLTYPNHLKEAHAHCLALLSDPSARYWFLMRAVVQYLNNDLICAKAWKGFNASTDVAIDASMTALQDRGRVAEARQMYVDTIHDAIYEITQDKEYQQFRSQQLTKHTKALRDLLAALLNVGCDRPKAGRDLGVLVSKAWDFSAKVFTSHLTFSIIFPDLMAKFTAGTMVAKNQLDVNPLQLQINQTRLKLVITPVVTLRDDRGTTVRVKTLHNSFVLTEL